MLRKNCLFASRMVGCPQYRDVLLIAAEGETAVATSVESRALSKNTKPHAFWSDEKGIVEYMDVLA